MLTQTETQSKNLLWISNNQVCFYPLEYQNVEQQRNWGEKCFNQVNSPYTSSSVLRNWFLAQSMRSLIMLSFQDKIQTNASVFIVILHNFSLHIKSTNLFWRERGDEKRKRDAFCCYERGEGRCWGRKKRWGEKGKGEERERKKLATFYLILNLNMEMKREDMNQNWGYFYPKFFDFLYCLVTIILEIWVLIVILFFIYIFQVYEW